MNVNDLLETDQAELSWYPTEKDVSVWQSHEFARSYNVKLRDTMAWGRVLHTGGVTWAQWVSRPLIDDTMSPLTWVEVTAPSADVTVDELKEALQRYYKELIVK